MNSKTITLPYEEYLELESIKDDFNNQLNEKYKYYTEKDRAELALKYKQEAKESINSVQSEHEMNMLNFRKRFDKLAEDYSYLNYDVNIAYDRINNYNKLSWWERIFNKV